LGAATVIAGAMMAPRCRPITATILAVLWTVVYFIKFFSLYPWESNSFWDYLAYVVGVIAAFGAAVYITRTRKR
jgi:type IV secretory pathway VirB2 component (pilin)